MGSDPLIVYLDTSDFSKFADIERDKNLSHLRSVYDELLHFKNSGRVDFRFSAAHLAEITKYETGHKDVAERKAKIIEELCDLKCLKFAGVMWKEEEKRAISSVTGTLELDSFSPLSDEGVWYPGGKISFENFKEEVIGKIKQTIREQPGLNRNQRRILIRQAASMAYVRQVISNMSEAEIVNASASLERRFPLSERFYRERYFLRLMLGEIDEEAVAREVMLGVTRPSNFVGWYFEKFQDMKKVPAWIDNLGLDVFNSINQLRGDLGNIPPEYRGHIGKTITPLFLRESMAKALRSAVREGTSPYRISMDHIDALLDLPYGAFPSMDLVSVCLHEYVSQHATSPRKNLKSDGGDFVHLSYAAYVHIFRSDRYFSSLVRKNLKKIGVVVAEKIENLPSVIIEEDAHRNS